MSANACSIKGNVKKILPPRPEVETSTLTSSPPASGQGQPRTKRLPSTFVDFRIKFPLPVETEAGNAGTQTRNRVFARHPRTQFLVLRVGNFVEKPDNVSENLDRFPNTTVDIAARIGELGRQPRCSRRFFDHYQDRILFGTDATPHGDEFLPQTFNHKLYEIYYRFLESEDEYFDDAPAKLPPQGRRRIYGIGLPEPILQKVYNQNAARLLQITV